MELLHLNYFREVAAVENITKAAKKLYVSQPALSTAIARLEKELDFLLFERKGNRIELTEAGAVSWNTLTARFPFWKREL